MSLHTYRSIHLLFSLALVYSVFEEYMPGSGVLLWLVTWDAWWGVEVGISHYKHSSRVWGGLCCFSLLNRCVALVLYVNTDFMVMFIKCAVTVACTLKGLCFHGA